VTDTDITFRRWRQHARAEPKVMERTIIHEDGVVTGVATVFMSYAEAEKVAKAVMTRAEQERADIATAEGEFYEKASGSGTPEELRSLLKHLVEAAERSTRLLIANHLMDIYKAMPTPLSTEPELSSFQEGWRQAAEEVRNG
jgi:hypothetical protein